MSNQQVGKVFGDVIAQVVEASKIDFEEGGVGNSTLEDLRKDWQKRLSELKVAEFPWDPPRPPQPLPLAAPATVPSNGPKPSLQSLATNNVSSTPAPPPPSSSIAGPARVKLEPITDPTSPSLTAANGLPQTAQQRAAVNLQQRYGSQAASQIGQLQGGAHGLPMQPQQQRAQVMPQIPINADGQKYNPAAQQQRPAVSNAQTDGSGDSLAEWKAEVARRRAEAAKLGESSDRVLMERMRERSLAMEGGGLLVPFDERVVPRRKSKGKSSVLSNLSLNKPLPGPESSSTYSELIKAQYDGPASEEDDVADEDAINSDLDDPDDLAADPEEEEEDTAKQEIMLCTYDKVQRVKNKWKCTLKDGLMTTGQRDYVFHKAQGEFEW